jgi:hypothetical protein
LEHLCPFIIGYFGEQEWPWSQHSLVCVCVCDRDVICFFMGPHKKTKKQEKNLLFMVDFCTLNKLYIKK